MTTIIIFLIAIAILLVINIIITLNRRRLGNDFSGIQLNIGQALTNTERNLKDEFVTNRKENADSLKNVREEVTNQLNLFTRTFSDTLKDNRKELTDSLGKFNTEVSNSLKEFGDRQRDNFSDLLKNLTSQSNNSSAKLELIRDTVEKKITELQKGNEVKLDEMRKTVDEKLNDTLEKRLGESFKLVSERLEAVHQGLGDMQGLAKDVGSLNKTMNNVKSRGILGEYQLQNLLEDLLTNEQYQKNVKTKEGSGAIVEFAIKMPGGNNLEKSLWLPIDSKFPKEDYEKLVDAYEKSDPAYVEECRKAFVRSIRKNAMDIKEKYIDPPNTTEYGLMFLPYESLYAEVLRTPGLFEQLQREYKITITGPTTLSAFLNSLQMGFRTLAIEKRSSEVWDLLGSVKTEFGKFGEVLIKTRKKLEEATNVIDSATTRSRAIERKLRNVQELPQQEMILGIDEIINKDEVDGLPD